eukprot:m.135859 g.135859  ORF g.135859 m.135859 type:complete len:57 (+) comp10253_c0_seq1:1464-1634(+)
MHMCWLGFLLLEVTHLGGLIVFGISSVLFGIKSSSSSSSSTFSDKMDNLGVVCLPS